MNIRQHRRHASAFSTAGLRPLCLALLAAGMLAACGGGGGGGGDDTPSGTGGNGTPSGGAPSGGTPSGGTPQPSPTTASMMMSCPDGATWQCSGTFIRRENGVALTNSGVYAYGRSTSDLRPTNPTPTGAFGLEPATDGVGTAEVRVNKDTASTVTRAALLLDKLDLKWDGANDRPLIVETFNPAYGRTVLASSRALQEATLPAETDLNFFDYRFANLGATATQANYANNRYFPRANPPRCADLPPGSCATTETAGLSVTAGDWRSGGNSPDAARAVRVHGDGDVHAGNGPNDASGNPTLIVGGTGPGVPFPGSKGYREIGVSSLRSANLASWVTQDTVFIREWTTIGEEHNKNRRGMVAFGDVTNPTTVPGAGSASYAGTVHGWYAPNNTADPSPFSGSATLTVNFATRQATIALQNATTDDTGTAVPANFSVAAGFGASGSENANYMTAPVSGGTLTGGVGGRFFGAVASGGSGAGPAEAAGTFTLSGTGGAAAIGGFIARKQ